MSMAGRLRSTFPLLQRILRLDSLSTKQRSTIQRSLIYRTFTNPEFSKNYATASPPKEEKIKVPLTLFGVSGNYASALYLASVKTNALDKVEYEFLNFVEASKRSITFSQFMKDLSVSANMRMKAINEICAEAKFCVGWKWEAKAHRKYSKEIYRIDHGHRGEVKAVVTTVIPLPPEEDKELKETLQDILGYGKKVKLEQKIDPSILGGIVVEFGQKVFDMSIKTRARQMERFLREPVA